MPLSRHLPAGAKRIGFSWSAVTLQNADPVNQAVILLNEKGEEEERGVPSFYYEAHDYYYLSVPFDRNENTQYKRNEAFSLEKAKEWSCTYFCAFPMNNSTFSLPLPLYL